MFRFARGLIVTLVMVGILATPVTASHASKNAWQRKNIEVQIYLPESKYLAWVMGGNAWEETSGLSFNPVNMGAADCTGVGMKEDKVRICAGQPGDCPADTNTACTGFKFARDDPHEIIGCKIWVIDPLFYGTVYTTLLATHEMGHCIGLNHNPDQASVMCGTPGCLGAGDTITAHDEEAVRKLYGRDGGASDARKHKRGKHRHHG